MKSKKLKILVAHALKCETSMWAAWAAVEKYKADMRVRKVLRRLKK